MTCIAAWVDEKSGTITMGGDSVGSAKHRIRPRNDVKVFEVGEFLVGFASSFRMGQILTYQLSPEPQHVDTTDHAYMCTTVITHIRKILKAGGFTRKNAEQDMGGEFLIAYRGTIYHIEADFQVGMPAFPFCAIGCGADLAEGAMYALWKKTGMEAQDIVTSAIKAASALSGWVGGPITILKQKIDTST